MTAVLDAQDQRAIGRLVQVPNWFAKWEDRLSRFRDNSELNELNRNGSGRVSRTLWGVIRAAMWASHESGGLVVPTMLTALEGAGYDRDFAEIQSHSARCPAGPALPAGENWGAIALGAKHRSVRLPAGVRLDVGGVAKGWAADRAVARLGAHGPALVDAGGDIAMSAPPREQEAWPIGVADPRSPDRQLLLLSVARGGVATSGRDYRRWLRNGVWQHHILDPRTGAPATTDVLSATAIGPSAHRAEVAAKVVLILGAREGLSWLDQRPEFAGLAFQEDGQIVTSRRFHHYLWS